MRIAVVVVAAVLAGCSPDPGEQLADDAARVAASPTIQWEATVTDEEHEWAHATVTGTAAAAGPDHVTVTVDGDDVAEVVSDGDATAARLHPQAWSQHLGPLASGGAAAVFTAGDWVDLDLDLPDSGRHALVHVADQGDEVDGDGWLRLDRAPFDGEDGTVHARSGGDGDTVTVELRAPAEVFVAGAGDLDVTFRFTEGEGTAQMPDTSETLDADELPSAVYELLRSAEGS